MTGKNVIEAILKREKITPAQLAKDIGEQRPQAIYDIVNGKTKNVSKNMAMKIKSAKPIYNEEWLLTGEGEMLDAEYTEIESTSPKSMQSEVVALLHRIDKLLDMHEKDMEYIERSSKQIDQLLSLLMSRESGNTGFNKDAAAG